MTLLPALRTGRVDAVLAHLRGLPRLGAQAAFDEADPDDLVRALAYCCPADALLPALVDAFPDLRLPAAALTARGCVLVGAEGQYGTLMDYFASAPDVGEDRGAIVVRALERLGFPAPSVMY